MPLQAESALSAVGRENAAVKLERRWRSRSFERAWEINSDTVALVVVAGVVVVFGAEPVYPAIVLSIQSLNDETRV